MTGRPVGDPPGCTVVRAQPDAIPVEFDAPRCCYAAWLTPELMRQTETQPDTEGQLAFGE